jgi:hypothetical protein
VLRDEVLSLNEIGPEDGFDQPEWGYAFASVPFIDGSFCMAIYEQTAEGREQLRIFWDGERWKDDTVPTRLQSSAGVCLINKQINWFGRSPVRGQ